MSKEIEKANALFDILKAIESNDQIEATDRLNDELLESIYPGLGSLIEDVFITPGGNPHYGMINVFEDNGIKVGPGETDRFGWVTGIISSSKGNIVF